MSAIWKDLYITLTGVTGDYTDYEILDGQESIFKGRAYAMPGYSLTVHPNWICAGRLSSDLDAALPTYSRIQNNYSSTVTNYPIREFTLRYNWNSMNFELNNDWSYDINKPDVSPQASPIPGGRVAENGCMSDPINGHAMPGQVITFSYINTTGEIISLPTSFRSYTISSNGGHTIIRTFDDPGVTSVDFNRGQVAYDLTHCGKRYALIYQNAYGGWDSFLLEGNCYRQGKTTVHKYERYVSRPTWRQENGARAITDYANEIQHSWVCNTSWLSDDESERLARHLLPSTDIYLQDIQERTLTPVVINDSTYKYKTYKNEGRKIISYQFTLTESNNELRMTGRIVR